MQTKKILIISPHFPPVNGADMHRVRQNCQYLNDFFWEPTIICVDANFVETDTDELLNLTIPKGIKVHQVKALPVHATRKFGLGALGLRSFFYFLKKGNELLRKEKFDLIFFSTTQFPVVILGNYWKRKFKIPYVIDMQDPWHSDFYKDKPKNEQPPKYWFSYRLNKYLEPLAMKKAAGIISVSQGYIDILQKRYKNILPNNCTVIPFGAAENDFEVVKQLAIAREENSTEEIKITYIGRGGMDMQIALNIIFKGFRMGLDKDDALFSKVKFYFAGTSYAKNGTGKPSIYPIAEKWGVANYVSENTNRMPYFESLNTLIHSDILIMPGSSDPNYTASKIYPYILAKKPLLAVFSHTSSVNSVFKLTQAGTIINFDKNKIDFEQEITSFYEQLKSVLVRLPYTPNTNWEAFERFTAKEMTRKQVDFFNTIV